MITTMTDKIRNDFAAYGLEMLKRSVLLVLYEADQLLPSRQQRLQMDEIRKQLGIRRITGEIEGPSNALLLGVLQHLQMDDLVNHIVDIGWKITSEGIAFIDS